MEFRFVGAEHLTEDLFRENPVWIMYEDPEQDEEICSWGVDVDKAWKEKSSNPENEYYFPYLGIEEPALVRGTEVYCSVQTNCGGMLSGVLLGGFAFSVYACGEQYLFNRNMPDYGAKASRALCSALGASEDDVFPLTYTPIAKCYVGKKLIHEKFW